MKKHLFTIITISIVLLTIISLLFFVKGDVGNPLAYQDTQDPKLGGPFESTNSTSRYVLTQSIVENNSLTLTKEEARSAAPDVSYHNGKFFSLFTPGVSFIAIPFYMLGKIAGYPQLVTYLGLLLFSILNVYLLVLLSKRLGAPFFASVIGGLTFLFATNALSYSLTMTQHQLTVTCIMLALLIALSKRNVLLDVAFGIICGIALLLDIPNIFFLLPIGIYMFSTHFTWEAIKDKIKITCNVSALGILVGLIPFIMLFAAYNKSTAGSYTLIAQSVGRTSYFDSKQEKIVKGESGLKKKAQASDTSPLNTRNELTSLYILFLSDERSWLYYSPVVLVGILGLFLAYRNAASRYASLLCLAVIGMNIAVYAMFGDPWGGWSFGPRYLIPSAALLSCGVSYAVWSLRKKVVFMVPFVLLLIYSSGISILGALTTSAIPPKVEALNLVSPLPYTYAYNFKLLEVGQLGSLLYNLLFVQLLEGQTYFIIVAFMVAMIFALAFTGLYLREEKS